MPNEQAVKTSQNKQLADDCQQIRQAILKGVDWLSDNTEQLQHDPAKQIRDLRIQALDARRLSSSARLKMSAAVYGASQAGKSYLISRLAYNENSPLMANFDGQYVNFIEQINPEGGQESTGLVTRFTIDGSDKLPEGHPVEVRLLSETDILKILVNSYVFDMKHDHETEEVHSAEKLSNELEQLQSRSKSGQKSSLTEEDILDIELYCNSKLLNKNSCGRIAALNKINFWEKASDLVNKLEADDLLALFDLLWDGVTNYRNIYRQLKASLEELGYPETAFCDLTGLFQSSQAPLVRNNDSIIAVNSLRGLGKHGGAGSVSVVGENGKRAFIARNNLTAIVAEMKIIMSEKPHGFFAQSDLLDFPGARTRRAEVADEDNPHHPFLRGKVAYLFERYCDDREVTSLLFCAQDSNQEVADLPDILFDWIKSTHGETPEERSRQINSLFFVLTKFDITAFAEKAGQGEFDDNRWTIRMEASLLQPNNRESCGFWPHKWHGEASPFNNCFCIRNPDFKLEHIFDYQENRELRILPDREEYIANKRQSFLANATVNQHFSDPASSWDSLMTLNDGGVSQIINQLTPLSQPELKWQRIEKRIEQIQQNALNYLSDFYVSASFEKEREKKMALLKQIRVALNNTGTHFPQFLHLLQITDDELYALYDELQRRPLVASNLSSDMDGDQDDESNSDDESDNHASLDDPFEDLFGDPLEENDTSEQQTESEEKKPAAKPKKEKIDPRVAQIMQEVQVLWKNKIDALAENQDYMNYFRLNAENLQDIRHEIVTGMNRMGVFKTMQGMLETACQFLESDNEAQLWKTITPIYYLYNEFISYLGMGGYFNRKGLDVSMKNITNQNASRHIFAPHQFPGELPELSEKAPDFGKDYKIDWLVGFSQLMVDNIPYALNLTVDGPANTKLGEILEQLETN